MDEWTEQRPSRREFLKLALYSVPVLALGGGLAIYKHRSSPTDDELRRCVLGYLAQPHFTNTDFMEQISGTRARLELHDMEENMAYFSIAPEDYSEQMLGRLTEEPSHVQFGQPREGAVELGRMVYREPGRYFFRFPATEFRVDRDRTVSVAFPSADYTLSMEELADFIENRSIYGGSLNAVRQSDPATRTLCLLPNYGAMVARKGEPSLRRLVKQLRRGSGTKEEQAQRLLDFTTNELQYDTSDILPSGSMLKRPNEVLMTRGGICGGKVVLYASLLEQTDVDYWLAYSSTRQHITTIVAGGFPAENGLTFSWGGRRVSVAETTAAGFTIGRSLLTTPFALDDIEYVQRPGPGAPIQDVSSGKPLPFE